MVFILLLISFHVIFSQIKWLTANIYKRFIIYKYGIQQSVNLIYYVF